MLGADWGIDKRVDGYLERVLQTPYGLQMTIYSRKTKELASQYHLSYDIQAFRFDIIAVGDNVFYAEQKQLARLSCFAGSPRGQRSVVVSIAICDCEIWIYHNQKLIRRLNHQNHFTAIDVFNKWIDHYLCCGCIFLHYSGWIVEPPWTSLSDIASLLDVGLMMSANTPYPLLMYCEKELRDSHVVVQAKNVRVLCMHLLHRDDWIAILSMLRDAGIEVDGEYEPQWLLEMQDYAERRRCER